MAESVGGKQGENAGKVFSELYPLLYASMSPISRCYEVIAEKIAAFADAHLGVGGKTVLDIGCGFGTVALAAAAYAPKKIYAVDSSEGMIGLLVETLLGNRNLSDWMAGKEGAREVLGEFYEPTLRHLLAVRNAFHGGIFLRRGGELKALQADGLRVDSLGLDPIDIIVGGNYLHWPVNQSLAELKRKSPEIPPEVLLKTACAMALRPLANVMKPGGIMVLMEGEDFITFDDSPEEEQDFRGNVAVEHPVFQRFHSIFVEIMEKRFGIKKDLPKRSSLFPRSMLAGLFAENGFELKRFHHMEDVRENYLASIFAGFPMLMGSVDIPFEEKLKLGQEVRLKLLASATPEELAVPYRSQLFFQVLLRV